VIKRTLSYYRAELKPKTIQQIIQLRDSILNKQIYNLTQDTKDLKLNAVRENLRDAT
jgi:hypothetical protein